MTTPTDNRTDDDVLYNAIAAGPKDINVLYVLPRNKDIADDIREGTLNEDEFGLLDSLETEERVTAAVLRCLAAGRLSAHHENDDDDPSLVYVVLTANPGPGDCIVYDGGSYADGDVLYAEIVDVLVDGRTNSEGDTNGYQVRAFCEQNPVPVEVFLRFGINDVVRISAADMTRAREAGWPRSYARFREVLGDEIPLLDSDGIAVPGGERASQHRRRPPSRPTR